MLFDEESADVDVAHVLREADESRPETRAEVAKALLLGEEAQLCALLEEHLDSVTNLSVPEVALHKFVVDLGISRIDQRFQENIGWNEKFLLLVDKSNGAVAVTQVM